MKQRPIIFNTEMVRVILDGRKTQTRRMFKAQPHDDWAPFSKNAEWYTPTVIDKQGFYQPAKDNAFGVSDEDCAFVSPFGTLGDQLWVREAMTKAHWPDLHYVSGGLTAGTGDEDFDYRGAEYRGFIPSIHMPRWAARILLEVTAVRVERLNEISEDDAIKEGFDHSCSAAAKSTGWYEKPRAAFLRTWEQIYHNVDANPWLWVVEFRVISTTGGAA
ncbi:hypothetical protein L5M38_11555 [Shewanella sp. SM101]|uniref:hypothetical protein n=1 Tax=Shewanella sp. SM101 TaxID=2912789 RepID=UPI0021D9B51F|nr:hypothetical protein [Shewanella sp. SM101]MCU8105170.1 hypothetical protein [Shewanella sp. SM101]